MFGSHYGKARRGGRPSARAFNRLAEMASAFENSQLVDSLVTNQGIANRRRLVVTTGSMIIKVMEVQSEAAGDGVYNCYEQTLDATEWTDTAGDPKFDDANTDNVEVLNLAEFDPESEYIAHLAVGDLIAAWQMRDDESGMRWVGVPFRQANADRTRIAYCKTDAGAGTTLVCYLDKDATGTEITVYFSIAQGGANLNEAAPRLKDGDKVFVQKIYDGTNDYWWCIQTFDQDEECDCYTAP